MRRFLLVTLLVTPTPALAGSIAAPAVIAGPDSGPATPDPAAVYFNPAAIAATEGVNALMDTQVAFIRLDITATRNDGIDPNTGEPYNTAKARVQVPVGLVGVTWKVVPKRLALGFAATDAFVGGGDYSAGETQTEPPYHSNQRYAGVQTELLTLHLIPAVGLTVVDGVHLGGSFRYVFDSISAIQASDPLGTEGNGPDGPYSSDVTLDFSGTGGHTGWSAGVYVDKWRYAQVGLSYTDNGTFDASGSGKLYVPNQFGGVTPDVWVSLQAALPPVIEAWVNSRVSDALNVGAGVEYMEWNRCCGTQAGDIAIDLTNSEGNALGPDDGIALSVAEKQYSPRRLWNAMNLAANAGYQLGDTWWFGGRVGYNQNAVPNYAVSATNLDFVTTGAQLAARYTFAKHLTVGLSYSKFFLQPRTITNSAWNAPEGSAYYVDDRFSPKNPYTASANGTYQGAVDIAGVRVSSRF